MWRVVTGTPYRVRVVLCSEAYYCYRACGAETIQRFLAFARTKKVHAIRIYATTWSQSTDDLHVGSSVIGKVWTEKWGFQPRESVLAQAIMRLLLVVCHG